MPGENTLLWISVYAFVVINLTLNKDHNFVCNFSRQKGVGSHIQMNYNIVWTQTMRCYVYLDLNWWKGMNDVEYSSIVAYPM